MRDLIALHGGLHCTCTLETPSFVHPTTSAMPHFSQLAKLWRKITGGRKKFFKKIDLKCSQRLTRDAFYWVSIISSPTKPCPATSKDRGCQWNMATSMLAKLQVLEQSEVHVLKIDRLFYTKAIWLNSNGIPSIKCLDGLVQGYELLGGHEFQCCWVAQSPCLDRWGTCSRNHAQQRDKWYVLLGKSKHPKWCMQL